jgi:hypothetical protein
LTAALAATAIALVAIATCGAGNADYINEERHG